MGKVRVRSGLDRLRADSGLRRDVRVEKASFRACGSRGAAVLAGVGYKVGGDLGFGGVQRVKVRVTARPVSYCFGRRGFNGGRVKAGYSSSICMGFLA